VLYHKEESMSMTANKPQHEYSMRRSQAGMASILITMVTMIVISLIVLGFATISRQEQGQTLDQQLNTQAFYAAETAVNDARQVVDAAANSGLAIPSKNACTTNTTPGANYPTALPGNDGVVIDASDPSVTYTCLLVNPAPSSLIYQGVGDDSVVVPVTSTVNIASISIQWVPTTPPPTAPSKDCPASLNKTLSPSPWKCGYGLLRTDLVPTEGALTQAGLTANTITGFFEPLGSGGAGTLSYANRGKANLVAAKCTTTSYASCTATITNLPANTNSFTLRLNSMYQTSTVTVTAFDSGGNPVPTDGQVTVDATGAANGVLRRIQVRLPVTDYSGTIPNEALQSNSSVCKRFSVTPGYFSIANDLPTPNPDTSNSTCLQQTSGSPQAGG
jgi:hypothetical protein